uniref:mechanosensitive ion channel family protein n=1 Tax=Trichocoleus desertorum TaxID=1481672 RepID=UPI0025B536D2|nr:mechanosensitive ion channel family protein [Trichocoleus desertorum]
MTALVQEVRSSLLNLIGQAVEAFPGFVLALIVLLLTRYVANVVQNITSATAGRMVRSQSLRSLLIQMSYVATWVTGVVIASVMAFPDLGVGDIIGLLGLGSVAIGFAFQDIFKNFLAGVLLLLNEPFRLHDQIIVSDFEGTVEEITIRSTQIRTYQGERVVIPNSIVFTSPVQVLTAMPHRRTDLAIGVDYNTPLPQVIQSFLETVNQVDGVLTKPAAEVDIVGFGESSIDLMVRYWTAPTMAVVRRTRTNVMIALKEACDRAGVSIPYPIRTVYFYDQQQFKEAVVDGSSGAVLDGRRTDARRS